MRVRRSKLSHCWSLRSSPLFAVSFRSPCPSSFSRQFLPRPRRSFSTTPIYRNRKLAVHTLQATFPSPSRTFVVPRACGSNGSPPSSLFRWAENLPKSTPVSLSGSGSDTWGPRPEKDTPGPTYAPLLRCCIRGGPSGGVDCVFADSLGRVWAAFLLFLIFSS